MDVDPANVACSSPATSVAPSVPIDAKGSGKANILHDIFRKDALDATHVSLGAPIKPVGVGTSAMTAFYVTVLIAVVLFLVNAKYARKETVTGQITPAEGAFRIATQIAGTANSVLVREGQVVKAGDLLISVSADPVLSGGATLMGSLKAIQVNQRRAQELQAEARKEQITRQIEELRARRDGLKMDIARLDESSSLLDARKRLLTQTADAHRKLAASGMVSPAFIRQQEDGLLSVRQQIQQSRRETGLQRSQLAQAEAQIGRLNAEASLASSEASTTEAQQQERELGYEAAHVGRLVAPIDGIVTALQVRAGSTVAAGQTLAVVIPSTSSTSEKGLEAELWAPSRAVGFVRPGTKVRIMYDAFPYQTFGIGHGVVQEISGTPLSPGEPSVPAGNHEQLFRIRVSILHSSLRAYGRPWTLIPGMRLSADLILEEQSLLEWVLGPLRAVRNRAN